MDDTYLTFLRLLDDSELLGHIATLSQDEPAAVSTPRLLLTRSESDPFNDGLDSQLLKLASKQPLSMLDGVPPNQLAVLPETGVDESLDDLDDNTTTQTGPDVELNETSEGNKDEVGPRHGFGDYRSYFRNKHAKQQNADAELVQWETTRRRAMGDTSIPTAIFSGCSIFVNGHTDPSLETIHRLVVLHGGKFIAYLLNKGVATHIICDRLTPRKRIEFRNYKVVTGKWIADCVARDMLLDWKEYRLIEEVDYCQQRLGFENLKGNKREAIVEPDNQAELDSLDELDTLEALKEPVELEELSEPEELQAFEEPQDLYNSEYQSGDQLEELDGNELEELAGVELAGLEILEEQILNSEKVIRSDPQVSIESVHTPPLNKEHVLLQPEPSSGRRQYVAMDARNPDFLAHFFANSRLHRLSTWKADLRAKFVRLVANTGKPRVPIPTEEKQKVILHIDFDCFFATVSAQAHSHLDINKDAIAVSHGGKSSDVASCNYVARAKGVANGMWLGSAMERCPDLKVIDYDFDAYEKASSKFYNYFISKGIFDSIFPVLIDEVLVDATTCCTSIEAVDSLCQEIRRDIFNLTRCSVSIGAGHNVLLAKLAIKKAKPNGHFHLHGDIDTFLESLNLKDLPGIGNRLSAKLAEESNSVTPLLIKDVRALSISNLCAIFGDKTGTKIYQNCRGIDGTSISLDSTSIEALLGRKSVSVDVNYGIRFDTVEQAELFFMNLSKELYKRLLELKLCGSSLTLKIARRHESAPINPPKYMGMGLCIFVSKSSRLGVPTNDWGIIGSEVKSLYRMLNIPPKDLRGIAISMTKLQDLEQMRKQRQRTLEFNNIKNNAKKVQKKESQDNPFAETVANAQSVDWDVFNLLPETIKQELKKELLRRGIPVSAKERSPTKRSPVKPQGQKVYLQQLFPTQPNGPFKSTRVIESPKKKRKLVASPTKSILPIKREPSPTPFNDTVSYDQDILNELPSTIRREFYEDLEWHRKNKKLVAVPLKEKFRRIQFDEKTVTDKVIDREWLLGQNRVGGHNTFINWRTFSEIRALVESWVKLSLGSRGPHSQDVQMFEKYIRGLIAEGDTNRTVILLALIGRELRLHESTMRICSLSTQERREYYLGLDDWKKHYEELKKSVSSLCKQHNIRLEI